MFISFPTIRCRLVRLRRYIIASLKWEYVVNVSYSHTASEQDSAPQFPLLDNIHYWERSLKKKGWWGHTGVWWITSWLEIVLSHGFVGVIHYNCRGLFQPTQGGVVIRHVCLASSSSHVITSCYWLSLFLFEENKTKKNYLFYVN